MQELIDRSVSEQRFQMLLLCSRSGGGACGDRHFRRLTYSVNQRMNEIGVRIALARRRDGSLDGAAAGGLMIGAGVVLGIGERSR